MILKIIIAAILTLVAFCVLGLFCALILSSRIDRGEEKRNDL